MSKTLFLIFLTVGICCGAVLESLGSDKLLFGSRENSPLTGSARCYDPKIAIFINFGLSYYAHNMGALSNFILDQITRARYPGYWFIHAQMIQNQHQGPEWQSATNGDLYTPTSTHGCYYHDKRIYVVVLRY